MLQNNIFGQRLAGLRKEKDISQYKLSDMLRYSRGQIANYEQGKRKPDFDTLINFADFFDVSIDYLLGRTNIRQPAYKVDILNIFEDPECRLTAGGVPLSQAQRIAVLRALENPAARPAVSKPLLGPIHAGLPILAEQNRAGEIEVPACMEGDFVLRVEDESMIYAGIQPGDLGIFKESAEAQNGQVVAAGVEEATWRAHIRFFMRKNGRVLLRPANPAYTDIEFGPKHGVIGFMVGLIKLQAPGLRDCPYTHQFDFFNNKQWIEIIETAGAYNIKPDKVKAILDMHWEMHKK